MGKQVNNLNFAVHSFCVFMWSLCVVQACECAGVPIYARALGGLRMTASFLPVTTQSLYELEAHHLANLVGRWVFRICLLLPPLLGLQAHVALPGVLYGAVIQTQQVLRFSEQALLSTELSTQPHSRDF